MKPFKQYFYEAAMSNWKSLVSENDELKSALELVAKIERATGKETLIVGGAARDLLLGQSPHDVDIASAATPEEIEKHFKVYDIGASKTFGIVVIRHNGFQFEVAQFRKDSYSDTADGRRPSSVDLVQSFKDDSSRRDFSINSLGINKDGEIVDYQNGVKDLNNKLIRAVGNPSQRFTEDALRILRSLRFSVKLGFDIEDETLEAARELAYLTDKLSKERIQEEIYKVASIGGKALADYIVKMDEIGLLQRVLPEVKALQNSLENPEHHPEAY